MPKYDPLKDKLLVDGRDMIVLTFAELEKLVGALPATSHGNQWWWGNEHRHSSRHGQCKAWIEAGYAASADLRGHTVTFRRLH